MGNANSNVSVLSLAYFPSLQVKKAALWHHHAVYVSSYFQFWIRGLIFTKFGMTNVHKIWVRKSDRPHGRPTRKCKDNSNMDLKEGECECVE